MKSKIDSAKAGRTFQGNDGPVQVYEVVAGGVIYDCLSEQCMKLIGQTVEFEVKNPSDPKYHPTMKFPKAGGFGVNGGKGWGGGKTFIPSFKDTAEGARLSAKTMLMSYAKDLAVGFNQTHPVANFAAIVTNAEIAYKTLLPLLALDTVKDPKTAEQTQPGGNGNGGGHKDIKTLVAEMKSLATMSALQEWWTNTPHAHLSADDLKILIAEKDKQKSEIAKANTTAGGRKPDF
jgi:hypothetical protein